MNARVIILHDVVAEAIDPRDPRDARELSEPGTGAANSFEAQVLTLQQPLMELTAHDCAERGAAVRIDSSDAIWLGEVEECVASGDGFSIRVRLHHVLRDFETLARLAERFGTEATKGIPVQI